MNYSRNLGDVCKKGKLGKVKDLVEKGADLEAKNKYGETPLIIASLHGQIEIIKFLVEKGSNIEAKNNIGSTPLFVASCHKYIEIVKFLVEKGSDIEAKDINGLKFTDYLNKEQKEEVEKIIYDIHCRKAMIKPCKKDTL